VNGIAPHRPNSAGDIQTKCSKVESKNDPLLFPKLLSVAIDITIERRDPIVGHILLVSDILQSKGGK
jgi:hypothetical protein